MDYKAVRQEPDNCVQFWAPNSRKYDCSAEGVEIYKFILWNGKS